jgi:hypothetical protein
MTRTFRQFIEANNFRCSILEQDAAPPMGAVPPQPENPDAPKTTNKYHFDQLQQQFGIGDSELAAALEGGTVPVFKVPDYSKSWGYIVIGPCSATVQTRKDGNYEVTFQLAQKKLMNPKAFIRPYKDGEAPVRHEGPVKDETVIMTAEELQNIMALPFDQQGAGAPPAGGGMPPLGGM